MSNIKITNHVLTLKISIDQLLFISKIYRVSLHISIFMNNSDCRVLMLTWATWHSLYFFIFPHSDFNFSTVCNLTLVAKVYTDLYTYS